LASAGSELGAAPPPSDPDHAGAAHFTGPLLAVGQDWCYSRLRERHGGVAPVLLDGDVPAWLVLGYRELHRVTSDPLLFGRDCRRWNSWHRVPDDWPLMPYVGWTPSVMFTEGAEHQRRAGAVGHALDATDRAQLAARCAEVADELIDTFAAAGLADLIAQYAQKLPIRALTWMYGLADAAIPELARDIADSLDAGPAATEAHQRLYLRMQQLVRDARRAPGPDLPSRLLAHPAGLTDDEAAIDLLVVLAMAQQATAGWIGNTLHRMLVDDEFSLALQGGRRSAGQALNEVLWAGPPVQNFIGRWAAQDTELGGCPVKRGDLLILGLAAANSDPQVQPGSAAEAAANRAHLSFGHGEHGCPFPAPELAGVIARTAVEVLLDRLPDLELSVPAETLQWRPSVWMRGLLALPVSFTPAGPAALALS